MSNNITIVQKQFGELSLEELYALLKIRVDVFVVEQACAYAEIDDQDQEAVHLMLKDGDLLIGCARILFEKGGLHIGRIVVLPEYRGRKLAARLMEFALDYCAKNHPKEEVHLSAQAHLESYYQSFGFVTVSDEPYDWDGILHVDMKK